MYLFVTYHTAICIYCILGYGFQLCLSIQQNLFSRSFHHFNPFYPSSVDFFIIVETHELIYKGDLHVA